MAARRKKTPVREGQRFGKLMALQPAGVDKGGNQLWEFLCDCNSKVTWRVSTVTYNVRTLGWCSCPHCYEAAGGWEVIQKLKRR